MSAKRLMLLIGALMVLVGGLVVAPFMVYANEDLMRLQNDDTQWVMQRKNYSNWAYSTLGQITRDNIKNLHVAWSSRPASTSRGDTRVPRWWSAARCMCTVPSQLTSTRLT